MIVPIVVPSWSTNCADCVVSAYDIIRGRDILSRVQILRVPALVIAKCSQTNTFVAPWFLLRYAVALSPVRNIFNIISSVGDTYFKRYNLKWGDYFCDLWCELIKLTIFSRRIGGPRARPGSCFGLGKVSWVPRGVWYCRHPVGCRPRPVRTTPAFDWARWGYHVSLNFQYYV